MSGVPTLETLAFLAGHLDAGARDVLEVGCGDGELAAALVARGHRLVALDSEPAAVARARARGVDARVGRWPQAQAPLATCDAIVFGRLLHHLPDLSAALESARDSLRPGGLILVEDYAWERVDRPTAEWVRALLLDVAALGGAPQADWDLGGDALESWWRNTRDEGLHTCVDMQIALEQSFTQVASSPAPYAYRWSARYLGGLAGEVDATRGALARERAGIAAGLIQPIGWRAVARRA